MGLSHQNIQVLHREVRIWKTYKEGVVVDADDGMKYEIINSENSATEAIAVAPVVNDKADYSKTIVLTAGTQDKINPLKNSLGQIGNTVKSVIGAADAAYGSGLSPQYDTLDKFFAETQKRLKEKGVEGGQIWYSSAHSQGGVPNVKLSVKYRVKEIVNFYDWGAKKAVDSGHFTKSELKYLEKHAIIYSDSGKEITGWDGNGGAIPYGKVRVFEGNSHSVQTPDLKGNNFDFDKYIKRGEFVSGMTEKQVRKAIEIKLKAIKNGKNKEFLTSLNPNFYLILYKKMYGDFAPEPSKQDLIAINRKYIDELHASLRTSSGDKKISLREELVRTSAQTAQLQAEVYEQEIKDKLASAKSKVEDHISELSKAAYTLAHNLSSGEVEELLSELNLSEAWNGETEASTLASASAYTTKMTEIAGNLNKAADNIVAIDQKGAQIFTKK
ncbi:hypothetical protein I6L85_05485 [Streptococcus gordonii]|uniref:hypothetical protein n=1 Tax=Streptococcus gordonii TaxID=1302 RepID=UPI000DA3F241|nr:hypothetical protein [Streptococcus gordonii]QXA17935.1 hypothetical protein I6L85_05485 [Streptococcus gordonii]SQG04076.1 Uncharacterised protein [Streptococcus gordonii]